MIYPQKNSLKFIGLLIINFTIAPTTDQSEEFIRHSLVYFENFFSSTCHTKYNIFVSNVIASRVRVADPIENYNYFQIKVIIIIFDNTKSAGNQVGTNSIGRKYIMRTLFCKTGRTYTQFSCMWRLIDDDRARHVASRGVLQWPRSRSIRSSQAKGQKHRHTTYDRIR